MDMTTWLEYFVGGFLVQMNDVMAIGKKVILKDTLTQNHNLSPRQGVIIEHILENGKLVPKDFDHLCDKMEGEVKKQITKRTLQRDLKSMVDKKVLKSKGKTNQKAYYLQKGI